MAAPVACIDRQSNEIVERWKADCGGGLVDDERQWVAIYRAPIYIFSHSRDRAGSANSAIEDGREV